MTHFFSFNRTIVSGVLSAVLFAVSNVSPTAKAMGHPTDPPVNQEVRMFVAVNAGEVSANELFGMGGDVFGRVGDDLHVLVPRHVYDELVARGVEVTVLHEDADRAYAEYRAQWELRATRRDESFSDYHDLEATIELIERVAADHPDLAALETIGQSVEGRPIYALRISENAQQVDPDKPGIVLMGCHHAREWISVEMALYLADYFTEQFRKDGDVTRLLRHTEIWIVPVVNPDGFVHSWLPREQGGDRFWRKNRRDNGDGTIGVDNNRNYGFKWGLDDEGSSGETKSQTYRGPSAFSEPETQAIRDLMTDAFGRTFATAITYHSYSQVILYPNGYTTAPVENASRYEELAKGMTNLINAAHNDSQYDYTYGQGSVVLYPTNGDFADWAHHEAGALAFTVELRPAAAPWFELPPDEIIPTCRENLPAVLHLAHEVLIPEAKAADADGDGFLDEEDYCPDSPTTEVDAIGCDPSEADLDEDGVPNEDDVCRDSPPNQQVDETGCRLPTLLTVTISSNVSMAPITVEPLDIDGNGRGDTGEEGMTREYPSEGAVVLTADTRFDGDIFDHWIVDGKPRPVGQSRIAITAEADVVAEAIYLFPRGLLIVGPTRVPDVDRSGFATVVDYEAVVVFNNESTEPLDQEGVAWSLDESNGGTGYASINASGQLVVRSVDAEAGQVTVGLSAVAVVEGKRLPSDPVELRIYDRETFLPACGQLDIDGPRQVASLGSAGFTALLTVEGGGPSQNTDQVRWSVASDPGVGGDVPAAVSQDGTLTPEWVASDTPILVSAEYDSDEGSSCTGDLEVTISAGNPADRPGGTTTCGAMGMLSLGVLGGGLFLMGRGRRGRGC